MSVYLKTTLTVYAKLKLALMLGRL